MSFGTTGNEGNKYREFLTCFFFFFFFWVVLFFFLGWNEQHMTCLALPTLRRRADKSTADQSRAGQDEEIEASKQATKRVSKKHKRETQNTRTHTNLPSVPPPLFNTPSIHPSRPNETLAQTPLPPMSTRRQPPRLPRIPLGPSGRNPPPPRPSLLPSGRPISTTFPLDHLEPRLFPSGRRW